MAQHHVRSIAFAFGEPCAPRPRLDGSAAKNGDLDRGSVFTTREVLNLGLEIVEDIQGIGVFSEDQHAAPGTGLLCRPTCQPAMVR